MVGLPGSQQWCWLLFCLPLTAYIPPPHAHAQQVLLPGVRSAPGGRDPAVQCAVCGGAGAGEPLCLAPQCRQLGSCTVKTGAGCFWPVRACAITPSCRPAQLHPLLQDVGLIFLSAMASSIASLCSRAGLDASAALGTSLLTMAVSSAVVGLGLLAVGERVDLVLLRSWLCR